MIVLCMVLMRENLHIFALLRAVMVIGLLGFVASCSGSVQPFSKSNNPSGKTPPAITVTAMNGLPADKAKVLFDHLSVAAGKRDIAIVRGAFQGGYFMVGEFEVLPISNETQVTYRWSVYNAQKQLIHSIANKDTGRIGGADPWSGVDPDLLRRIAGFTAENLATRLNVLGYATRLSGLPPPGRLELAGPNADKDIDYERVYGPGAVAPPSVAVAPPVIAPPSVAVAQTVQPQEQAAAKPASSREAKGRTTKVSAVAMTTVTGAPGTGNRDLLVAMRKVMKSAGWPVLKKTRSDALTVTGAVALDKPNGSQQKVAVAWTVRTPDGKILGTVRQANNVPAGSLDKGWGKSATYVSQAAAQGIFKLVKSVK